MKIIILHGDNTYKSYERLTKFIDEAKKRGWEIVNDQISFTPSLFGNKKLIVYRKYQLLTKTEIARFSKLDDTLVIYNEGIIPQAFLKTLPKDTKSVDTVVIEEFKLPKIIWNFLDNISIRLFHEVIKTEPVEFVFALLAKRFRDLYWVKTEPRTMNYELWQIQKLKRQSEKCTTREVEHIINKLAEIDIKVKTGKSDLISELDLLLIKSLE